MYALQNIGLLCLPYISAGFFPWLNSIVLWCHYLFYSFQIRTGCLEGNFQSKHLQTFVFKHIILGFLWVFVFFVKLVRRNHIDLENHFLRFSFPKLSEAIIKYPSYWQFLLSWLFLLFFFYNLRLLTLPALKGRQQLSNTPYADEI